MSRITFGKSAYVPGIPEAILDQMTCCELSITAESEGLVIVTRESVQKFLDDYTDMTEVNRARLRQVKEALSKSLQEIDGANSSKEPIGDIFYTT